MPASLFRENQDQLNQNIQVNGNPLESNLLLQLALELSSVSSMMNNEALEAAFVLETTNQLKKSQNTTECVPVPSSEHVAEIVGRQGCKIKALRSKTNTYIKTPVRGEEPVFVVTGRKEDVNAAKREILSAAEHFSQIRAQRKNSLVGGGAVGLNGTNGQPLPGQCTIKVRVPYRVVGLVVGPKGATIKRIQHETSTYIITPSREKEPVFEVTGLPESVKKARYQIEAHIANRTGLSKLNALSLTSLIDDLDGSGSASSSGGSSLTSGLPFDLNYILNSSSAPNSDASTLELFQKMFLSNQDSTKNTLTNDTDNKWDLLQNNANGSSIDQSIEPALAGNGTSGAMHSSFALANKNANDFDNFSSFKMNAGRNLLKNNMNSFDNSSGGSNSSSSSVSGSSGPSRNLGSINSENTSKMLLSSSVGNPTSTNERLNDFYEQFLSNSSSRPSHISSSVSNGSQLHNASSIISSSASSTQLTRSNSPTSNHHNNLSTSVGTSLNNPNAFSFLTTSTDSINPTSGNSNGQSSSSSSSGNGITSGFSTSFFDRDEGIGESPTFDSLVAANLANVVSSMIARSNATN